VANLEGALRALAALPSTEVVAASRAYETAPAYYTEQDAFANAVVEVATELHPMALLEALLGIEAAAGRVRGVENGPRVLDLDLLWMEGERHAGRRLALPHPLMGERDFVLRPLADLVGDVDAFCAREGVARPAGGCTVGAVERDLGGLTL
jgi:2-amino-4-hydroxy-6-hydroxymethyldihydropteridine diphosphokinase